MQKPEFRIQESEFRSQNPESASRTPARRFQDLIVWQKAHKLVLKIYKTTRVFPKEEIYGLTTQIRRATVSVSANIAEGFKRKGKPDKIRFLNIAQASLEEVRYYLILASDLEYINETDAMLQLEETSKLLESYQNAILNSDS